MKFGWSGAVLIAIVGLGLVGCSSLLSARPDAANPQDFIPSGANSTFEAGRFHHFAEYLAWANATIRGHLAPISTATRDQEIRFARPYEKPPAERCEIQTTTPGVLLVHGLGDTPSVMDSLADHFADQCFLVRVLLLPGHGTRPADLIDTTKEDWASAVQFGVDTLKRDADTVYVGGFSLGGLLAIQAAQRDSEIAGVIAIAPALRTGFSFLTRQTTWLRHLFEWADQDVRDDPGSYDSMPMNGIAQTVLLADEVTHALKHQALEVPVFLAQSADDNSVDVKHNEWAFNNFLQSDESKLLIYRRQKVPFSTSERTIYSNSYLPQHKILNFSHRSVHVAPSHPHYGATSDRRDCGESARFLPSTIVENCEKTKTPWKGERVGINTSEIEKLDGFERLTYNPKWSELTRLIGEFVNRTSCRPSLSSSCAPRDSSELQTPENV